MLTTSCMILIYRTTLYTYHTPPEGVCVAGKMTETAVVGRRVVFLCQIDEIWRENETEKSDVQRRY